MRRKLTGVNTGNLSNTGFLEENGEKKHFSIIPDPRTFNPNLTITRKVKTACIAIFFHKEGFALHLPLQSSFFMKDSLTVSTSLRKLLSLQESTEKLPVISPTKQVPNQVEGSSDVLIIGWCQQVSHRNNNHSHIYPESFPCAGRPPSRPRTTLLGQANSAKIGSNTCHKTQTGVSKAHHRWPFPS